MVRRCANDCRLPWLSAFSLALCLALLLAPVTTATADSSVDTLVDSLQADPRLADALNLLASSNTTRDLIGVLETNNVSIQFIAMPPNTYARYDVSRHVIDVDSRWSGEDPTTMAAVLAHEATHAQDSVSGYLSSGGASSCIGSEIHAFHNSALFWLEMYGPSGKPDPADELERQMNLIADRELNDPQGLETLIRLAYTDQCGTTSTPS